MASSNIDAVQARVNEVQGVMQDNVQVMVANVDKTQVLEDKSAALADQAKTFHKTARQTRKHFWWQLCQQRLVIAGLCGVVLLILIIVIAANAGGGGGGDGGGGGSSADSVSQGSSSGATQPSAAVGHMNATAGAIVSVGAQNNATNTTNSTDATPPASPVYILRADFTGAAALAGATYRDDAGFKCAHELAAKPGMRTVALAQRLQRCLS